MIIGKFLCKTSAEITIILLYIVESLEEQQHFPPYVPEKRAHPLIASK